MGFRDYLEITRDKTAYLFSACCRSAGIVSDVNGSMLDALSDFGLSFGLLFQMVDDLIDRDHHLDPSVDLGLKTREFAERAKGLTNTFNPGPPREKLTELVDFVLRQLD
jgi:hypothetical protein